MSWSAWITLSIFAHAKIRLGIRLHNHTIAHVGMHIAYMNYGKEEDIDVTLSLILLCQ